MITRRSFLRQSGLGLAGLAGLSASCASAPKVLTEKPNFLFILADDLGWKDLGCYGSPFYETPNLDRLAAQGMRFTQAYASCPVCSPTRASIMTGKYPARTNTTDWFGAPQPETAHKHRTKDKPLLPAPYDMQMALEETTVAESLKEAGYATFFAGKWHMGDTGFFPEDQGFDVNKGGHHRGSPPGGYFSPYKNPKLESGPEGEHLPDRLARETVKFITEQQEKPFLAYLSLYSVHTPLQSRQDLQKKYKAKGKGLATEATRWEVEGERKLRLVQDHAVYAGMVEAMDQAIGTVLESLDALGLSDNTVVIFMSDNGGLSTSEGHPTSNLPLRAGKGWLYEGGIREPMIIKWPGVAKAGSTCDTPVISTDFYPTMLEMAGLPAKPEQHCDGASMTPLLKGGTADPARPIFWHYPHYGNQGGSPGAAIREGDYKLIEFFEDDHVELYDIRKDIAEEYNLAPAMPEKVKAMREKLDAWQRDVDARFPTPNPNAKKS